MNKFKSEEAIAPIPCSNHALAYKKKDPPEIEEMLKKRYVKQRCSRCGWTVITKYKRWRPLNPKI